MSLVRRNIVASFIGQGWVALMGFVFVPFYLKFIGAEGYGLVGFFVLLDPRMSTNPNRVDRVSIAQAG